MTLDEIHDAIEADICCRPADYDPDLQAGYAADVMSDVLAFAEPGSVLITGLRNLQVIRTAEIQDIPCVIFTRGKIPNADMIALAKTADLCVMCTQLATFTVCGLLYEKGMKGANIHEAH